jgi:hypothetical protein
MCSGRKHTPITSRKQQRLFGAVASGSKKLSGLSKAEAVRHLKESKGKDLPEVAEARRFNKHLRKYSRT